MMVLVDTPIWSLAFRRHAPAKTDEPNRVALRRLIEQGHAVLLGLVRQELLSGIREPLQYSRLRELLRSFPDVELATEDYEIAAQLNNACRAKGVAGSPVDFLICAVCLRRNWQVFTTDRDFNRYRAVTGVKLYPVA